jgi:hypothetical protein
LLKRALRAVRAAGIGRRIGRDAPATASCPELGLFDAAS